VHRFYIRYEHFSEKAQGYFLAFCRTMKREADFHWIHGHPILTDALANILCNVYSLHVAGDHIIGEVTDIYMKEEGDPLLFFGGKYRSIAKE
jgi:flavin reductase (DIM6/NTAB) family NADH-FMN oxidoreductase RutF